MGLGVFLSTVILLVLIFPGSETQKESEQKMIFRTIRNKLNAMRSVISISMILLDLFCHNTEAGRRIFISYENTYRQLAGVGEDFEFNRNFAFNILPNTIYDRTDAVLLCFEEIEVFLRRTAARPPHPLQNRAPN
ncbi:uncharacterized protein [Antedon mediterranea]|uniref:uncharacterized protein n=1 Tax=Antedon mediterranea TaxID=105859 RepID=UPI003AF96767